METLISLFESYSVYFGLVMVGVIWGVTNPLIERGTKQKQESEQKGEPTKSEEFDISLQFFVSIFTRLSFVIPFIVNQLGSVLFNFMLGKAPLNTASAIANSSSSVVTILTESIIKKKPITIRTFGGILCVVIGIYLCVTKDE